MSWHLLCLLGLRKQVKPQKYKAMTLLKVENNGKKAQLPTFDTWFDQLFDFPSSIDRVGRFGGVKSTLPAVNIKEDENSFQLEVAAPGFAKEDFKINYDHEQLTISSERKEEHVQEEKITRREFSYQSFRRSFYLPEDMIDVEGISAHYKDGILLVVLPKKEPEHKQVKQIEIK
jgi:HSP20 family protein